MRFRWKLLILLILIAIVPIVAMRTFGVRAVRSLADQLIANTMETRISDAKSHLGTFIDSYSQLLRQKRRQLEMLLAMQEEVVSKALGSAAPPAAPVRSPADFVPSGRSTFELVPSSEHLRTGPGGSHELIRVSYKSQVFYQTEGRDGDDIEAEAARLTRATPFYEMVTAQLDGLVLWHCIALTNGLMAVYPGHGGLAARYEPERQHWYHLALQGRQIWTEQFSDPLTGQEVIALAGPVKRADGSVAGATALIVRIGRLLENNTLQQNLPAATQSYLVGLVQEPGADTPGARILAHQQRKSAVPGEEGSPINSDWLLADDPGQHREVMRDFKEGRSNVRRVRYRGCDCLWVYGPVHEKAILLLTTPYRELLAPVEASAAAIQSRIEELLKMTRYMILLILAVVVALAFAFARTVTRPMQILAEGAQGLAAGRFDTRVEIRSSDEFGEMGRVFNSVGPQLEAHARMLHTLELAQEVQQHFLPDRSPRMPGLDIAGRSIYCEEIGGDYFDYLEFGDDPEKIGVVIGDVSGHGIPSALLMTTARALLRQRASLPGGIRQVVSDVNLQLCKDIAESGQFMTMFYAELRPAAGELAWVRAGHYPALLYDPATGRFDELMGEGTTLGVSCEVGFEECRRDIRAGQILLLSTDGIHEARNAAGEMFGREPIRQAIRNHARDAAEEIVAAILAGLEAFQGPSARQEDDVTLVAVKVL